MKKNPDLWGSSTQKKLIVEFKLVFLIIVFSALNVLAATARHSDLNADLQQQIVITGTVTDVSTGEALPGVNIQVKGTTVGAITDINGKYSITSVFDQNSVLVFSFIGYVRQEVAVAGRSVIDISLTSELTGLDEVVVVGYGTQKKVNVIGSVSQITSENIENRPVSMLSNALTGQMAGVTVIQRSGRPGFSEGTIRVRGVGSFGAEPDAMILIDGIPGTMNNINPNDIKNTSFLINPMDFVY